MEKNRMIRRDTETAAAIMGGKNYNGKGFFDGFATDSRAVKPGDMFLCLRGERTDGHKYVSGAVERGASAILCEEPVEVDCPYILVENTVKAIQKLASEYRNNLDVLVVGITGSVGKTTTKEFTHAILSTAFPTHKTEGNKNSETGLPITLLGIDPEDQVCVAEMGMSGLGEIEILSRIAKPKISVITNIGYSHIEYLKTRENILRAKMEICSGMPEDGVLILNGDDDLLSACKDRFGRVVFYGIKNKACDILATDIQTNLDSTTYTVSGFGRAFPVTIPAVGQHYVMDSLAGIAVGITVGLSDSEIQNGAASFRKAVGRQNIYEKNGYTIIDDTYNAVPVSMKVAFDLLRDLPSKGKRIAVIGDMLELGDFTLSLHREVGEAMNGIDQLLAFGNYAHAYAEGAAHAGLTPEQISLASDRKEALSILKQIACPGDTILFKASRSMQAEEILHAFLDD